MERVSHQNCKDKYAVLLLLVDIVLQVEISPVEQETI